MIGSKIIPSIDSIRCFLTHQGAAIMTRHWM